MTPNLDRSRTYAELPPPFGKFAHASVVEIGGQKMIFVSGVTARDAGVESIEDQTRVVYERIGAILKAEGGSFAHVLKMNVYLTDIADYPVTNKIREIFFAGCPAPASTLVEVSAFVWPGVRVEIECVAVV